MMLVAETGGGRKIQREEWATYPPICSVSVGGTPSFCEVVYS